MSHDRGRVRVTRAFNARSLGCALPNVNAEVAVGAVLDVSAAEARELLRRGLAVPAGPEHSPPVAMGSSWRKPRRT